MAGRPDPDAAALLDPTAERSPLSNDTKREASGAVERPPSPRNPFAGLDDGGEGLRGEHERHPFVGFEAGEDLPGGVDPRAIARKLNRGLIWKYSAVTVV
jgi:hypothetical protein